MIDSLDQELINLLSKNARQSSDMLAGQLGVDSSTVRRRINKLVRQGVLTFSINPNPDLIGFPVRAVLALDVAPDRVSTVIESLRSREEIRWISPTSGRFDIIAIAWFPSNESIYSFLEGAVGELEGVRRTETFICLSKAEDSVRHRI